MPLPYDDIVQALIDESVNDDGQSPLPMSRIELR
jgi:hypothetical protein